MTIDLKANIKKGLGRVVLQFKNSVPRASLWDSSAVVEKDLK